MKLILVTGASSGVGAATAREFAKNGSKVILVARSADQIQSLGNEIRELAVPEPRDAADPKPDRKGARAQLSAPLSESATRCFSTEWAGSGPSLQYHQCPVP